MATRIVKYASGKRVRQTLDSDGRIVKTHVITNKSRRTKTGRKLAKRRRRILR